MIIPWWLVCSLLWSDDWRIVAAGLTVFVAQNESTGRNYSSILGLNLTSSALSRSPVNPDRTESLAKTASYRTARQTCNTHKHIAHVYKRPVYMRGLKTNGWICPVSALLVKRGRWAVMRCSPVILQQRRAVGQTAGERLRIHFSLTSAVKERSSDSRKESQANRIKEKMQISLSNEYLTGD